MEWKKVEKGTYRIGGTTVSIKKSEVSPEIIVRAWLGYVICERSFFPADISLLKIVVDQCVNAVESYYE